MVRLDNGKYIIGFDNGYQFGKTARTLFGNGVHAMGKVEPSVVGRQIEGDANSELFFQPLSH